MDNIGLLLSESFNPLRDEFTGTSNDDLDPYVPEHWANESLAILIENMVVANLVHRDFEDTIASEGDVVNTRQPGSFTAKRKRDGEDVDDQNASATNVPVTLNQHLHVSFLLYDGERSKAFKDLVTEFLEPAIIAIASGIDQILLGQAVQFIGNNAGLLGLMSSTTAKEYILDTREVLNTNKVPVAGRNMILSASAETQVLKDDSFTSAEKVGDEGTALREASLGRKLGFNLFMCQNASGYTNSDTGTANDINNGLVAAGTTVITLTDSSVVTVGDMITVATHDMIPQRVTAVDGTLHAVTITPGLKRLIVDADVVTVYDAALVNQATTTDAAGGTTSPAVAGYRAGWHKGIILDNIGSTLYPVVGQQVVFGTASVAAAADAKYTITAVDDAATTNATITLDRPLDAAIVDDALVSLYPTGDYSFAFHKNALALITRPLALPFAGAGALSAVVDYDNIAIRATIAYDSKAQAHRVTVDLLLGVAVLNSSLGAVMFG